MQSRSRSAEPVEAAPTSRRAARQSPSRPRRTRRPGLLAAAPHLAPRAAILLALVTATIVVPLAGGEDAPAVAATAADPVAGYPAAVDVLSTDGAPTTPTSLLAAVPGVTRTAETVSRSVFRDSLPGCDGQAREASANGQIPAVDLCALWDTDQMLRGDAAVALSELNANFKAAFGRNLCITDSYRSLAEQRRVAWTKPGLAATPGTSNHGWGLAIDLCTSENRSDAVMGWLADNGPTFGWDNPQWARAGGAGAYEPWHWEFVPGTTQLGTNY